MKIKYFMTILMVAVTTFFASCANPSTIMPETPVTPVTPEPPKPIQHFAEKVLWEGDEYYMDIQADMFENTGDVPREIIVTFQESESRKQVGLLCSVDNSIQYINGTWSNNANQVIDPESNCIIYNATGLDEWTISYLPTQDEWNTMKTKGLTACINGGSNFKKIVIKEI
nr:hypothetical protein [uncultured Treponema sp.]